MINIIIVILTGIIIGSVTKFFLYLIGNPYQEKVNTGAIFAFYGVWVRQKHDEFSEHLQRKLSGLSSEKEFERKAARMINIFKALGACPWCVNVYISALFGCASLYYYNISLWHLVYLLPISHLSLSYIIDHFD